MINKIHSLLYRPERGWDPVPAEFVRTYTKGTKRTEENAAQVEKIAQWVGGLEGKTVLDLGAGPGYQSVELAKRGAIVTWHDVSRGYRDAAQRHAEEEGQRVELSLGYLEDAARFRDRPFDLVFCRGCWAYCLDDTAFARLIYDLIKPGGFGYVSTNTDRYAVGKGPRRALFHLYERFDVKIGHPHPPHGKVASLFSHMKTTLLVVDYATYVNDVIFFRKEGGEKAEPLFAVL